MKYVDKYTTYLGIIKHEFVIWSSSFGVWRVMILSVVRKHGVRVVTTVSFLRAALMALFVLGNVNQRFVTIFTHITFSIELLVGDTVQHFTLAVFKWAGSVSVWRFLEVFLLHKIGLAVVAKALESVCLIGALDALCHDGTLRIHCSLHEKAWFYVSVHQLIFRLLLSFIWALFSLHGRLDWVSHLAFTNSLIILILVRLCGIHAFENPDVVSYLLDLSLLVDPSLLDKV